MGVSFGTKIASMRGAVEKKCETSSVDRSALCFMYDDDDVNEDISIDT